MLVITRLPARLPGQSDVSCTCEFRILKGASRVLDGDLAVLDGLRGL